MDLLLGLIVKISREYGFSAFVLALMMMIFYWIVTNQKLIAVADRVLNRSLTASNLYRFIKLGIILVFAFSTVVVVLSFTAPIVMRQAENRSLELVLKGKAAFQSKDYDQARIQLSRSLALMNPDEPSADEIRGLITATYYVANLHEKGLEFICEQYRYKPASDRSYLFSVHAHLRKIAVDQGTLASESMARGFRKKCNRVDFSPFWAHISFGMMESLRTAKLRTEHGWQLTEVSSKRIAALLAEEQNSLVSKKVPLGDYVLYFLSEFDELLSTYPESTIGDMALFDAAMFSKGPARLNYLEKSIQRYPKSPRFNDEVVAIAALLATTGQRDRALSYVALIKDGAAIDKAADAALGPTYNALTELLRQGDLPASLTLAASVCQEFKARTLPCNKTLDKQLQKLERAARIVATNYKTLKCTKSQTQLRDVAALENKTFDSSWLFATRAFLVSCIEGLDDPEDYARSLYLIASLSRRVGDYKMSLTYLERFQREITDHDLLDDVLTEIGYHKLVLEDDWQAAMPYFQTVITKYPTRNAYDNALWWYAKGSARDGNYVESMAAYAKISSNELSSRFKKWSGSEERALQRLVEMPPFAGVALRAQKVDEGGLAVASLSADSPVAKFLRVGDRLIRVCDARVSSIEEALAVVSQTGLSEPCRVMYLRDRTLLHFDRNEDHTWKAQSVQLNSDQLRRLVLGS